MAELVEEDERPERANERDQDQPEGRLRKHQWQLAFIMALDARSRHPVDLKHVAD